MQLDNVYENLFGTLDRKYCAYYQYLMYITFGMFVISVLTVIMRMFAKGIKKARMPTFIDVLSLTTGFVSYFSTRLLYSMCVR